MRCSPRTVALILVLPVVSAVCFHRLIASPGSLIVDGRRVSIDHADRGHSRGLGNDLTSVFLPRYCYLVDQTRQNGKRPAWDASGFGGRPLVGNPQAGLNYPPVWAAWWSGQPGSLGWLTVGHLLWAGLGVFVLARSLGFGRPASIVAGGCFQASPYLIAHTFEGHYPHVWSACWYPWAFWGLLLTRRHKALGYWVLPSALALTFLTGHPQEWYYLVLAITVWVTADGLNAVVAGRPREAAAQVGLWGGLLALSLGLCAIEWLPELAVRPWLLKTSAIPLAQLNRYQLHSLNLLQLLSPFALGRPHDYTGHDNYWETVFSIGLAPLVLAIVGASLYRDRVVIRQWGTLLVVSVVFAAGKKLGLFALAYSVLPGMERFRVPSRTLFLASLAASVLAGAGVETLWRRQRSLRDWIRWRTRLRAGLVAVGLFAVLIGAVSVTDSREKTPKPNPLGGSGLSRQYEKFRVGIKAGSIAGSGIFWGSLVAMIGVVSVGKVRRSGRVAAIGLGTIALVEVSLYAQSLLQCAPVATFLGDPVSQGIRKRFSDERSGPVRIASVGSLYSDLAALASCKEKTNVNDSFQIEHSANLYERLYPILEPAYLSPGAEQPLDAAVEHFQCTLAQAVMDVLSVRYLVADRPIPLKSIEPLEAGSALWRNRTALPRAYVVPRAVVDAGWCGETVARRLSEFEPRDGVLMDRDPLESGDRQPFLPAEWISHDPDAVTIRVETSAPGLLVIGNAWMPGWTACVDSSSAPVLRGNHWQQVVPIANDGRHEIVLRYEPPGLAAGIIISAAAVIAWGGAGLLLLARHAWKPAWGWE